MPGPNTPYTRLDFSQVIQQSFDESQDRLRVDAQVSATISDIQLTDPDTGYSLRINSDGTIDVNVIVSAAGGDSIKSWTHDGSGNVISSTSGALHVSDGAGSLTVDATDLDIRNLSHTQDSVKVGDGTTFIKVDTNGSQYNVLASPGGQTVLVEPYGNLKVSGEGSTLFFDHFEGAAIDTSNKWVSTTSSATITQTNSVLAINTGTTSSARGALSSIPLFLSPGYGFIKIGVALKLESSTVSNTHRFWGLGNPGTSISSTNPISNGTGFEVTTGGVLRAVVYSGDSVLYSSNLTIPTDNEYHSYLVIIRPDQIFWFLDDFDTPVASTTYKNSDTSQLPLRLSMVNGSTPPGASPTFNVMAVGIADSSSTNFKISDTLFPWRTASVDMLGNLRTTPSTDSDAFGAAVSLPRICQVAATFDVSLNRNDVSSSVSGGGTATQGSGLATISTGTATSASAKIYSNKSIKYAPGRGIYAQFTAAFTTPTNASSYQRIGLYDTNNGLFLGYNGTTFGVTRRSATSDTFIAQSSFNSDPLDGNPAASKFTSNGVAQAVDFTKLNIYRIDFGFLGTASIKFQILSPDGGWVTFHTIRYPNTASVVNLENPNLPMTADVSKTSSDATNLQIKCGSWDAGSVEDASSYEICDFKSRRYVTTNVVSQTTDQTVYTVNTGRTLHVSTLIISISNASLAATGQLNITDGNGGTILIPMTIPASTNQSSAGSNLHINFPVTLRFTSAVYADVISGTLTYNVTFVGYEAEI